MEDDLFGEDANSLFSKKGKGRSGEGISSKTMPSQSRDTCVRLIPRHRCVGQEGGSQHTRDIGPINGHPCKHWLRGMFSGILKYEKSG